MTMRLPQPTSLPMQVSVDEGTGGQPQKRIELSMDSATGNVVRRSGFADQTAGRRARSWLRFLHTGEALGLAGQTTSGIASFAAVMLSYTGITLSIRRLLGYRRRVRSQQALAA